MTSGDFCKRELAGFVYMNHSRENS